MLDLYASEPIFRDCLDRCAEQLLPHLGLDLREVLYPSAENAACGRGAVESHEHHAARALLAGVFACAVVDGASAFDRRRCLATASANMSRHALPVFSRSKMRWPITAVRGRLMEECAPGSMLAVALAREEIPALGRSLDRGRQRAAAMRGFRAGGCGRAAGTATRRSRACSATDCRPPMRFTPSMMDPILESFLAQMRRVSLRPPRIPYLSNLTGTWITAAEATDPEYWAQHLRNTVRFSDCVTELLRQPGRVMIEVGPGQTLASLVRQHIGNERGRQRRKGVFLLAAPRGNGCRYGVPAQYAGPALDRRPDSRLVRAAHAASRSCEFRCPPTRSSGSDTGSTLTTRLGSQIGSCFRDRSHRHRRAAAMSEPERTETESAGQDSIDNGSTSALAPHRATDCCLAGADVLAGFSGPDRIGQADHVCNCRARLMRSSRSLPATTTNEAAAGSYTIRPGVRDDYDALLADLTKRKISPRRIVHLWSVRDGSSQPSLEDKLDLSFYSLLFLAQAMGEQDMSDIDIAVVSDRLHSVTASRSSIRSAPPCWARRG